MKKRDTRHETRDTRGAVLERHFEGRAQLAKLLEKAGSVVAPDEVAEGFARAQADQLQPADVIPALFDEEPRFDKASDAAALYSNLLGLWDLIASGKQVDLTAPPPREKVKKPEPIPPPSPFEGEPDEAWVSSAWGSFETAPEGELTRLSHSFDNKQDALVQWLEQETTAANLSDEAFSALRDGVFELFAMLQRSQAKGWPKVKPEHLEGVGKPVPAALAAFADEACFEIENDEALALPPEQSVIVRRVLTRALAALWEARH